MLLLAASPDLYKYSSHHCSSAQFGGQTVIKFVTFPGLQSTDSSLTSHCRQVISSSKNYFKHVCLTQLGG